MELAVVFG
jgi:hypothetical protein